MKIVEKEHCFLIKDFFEPSIYAGFTKPDLSGQLPESIYKALSFLDRKFEVSFMDQIHSADVNFIDKPGMYRCDAIFTNKANNLLVVKTADCLPLLFSGKKHIGVVHMGWRGAAAGIIDNLNIDFPGSKVIASAGLRKCCYEFTKDLKEDKLKPFLNKGYFDVIEFTKQGLVDQGLREQDFLDLRECSFCSKRDFFSYRKTKTDKRTLSFVLKV